ncbi:MAG: hypothetical protein OXM03_04415 [Chloroflexota bacterium]|nr:hypothetical protein [Caldilineaceae bacterium]MDE0455177.1 hypothetical protein [Gammaproteobacteria bacterium]MDE2839852.1 hypothetical protein [Chloroflexota bacterium]
MIDLNTKLEIGREPMRKLLVCVLLACPPLIATTQSTDPVENEGEPPVTEKWECREFMQNNERVLITLWRSAGTKPRETGYGRLQYAGVSFPAAFSLDGMFLRWNWDLNEESRWEQSFVIELDGTGSFYDFSDVNAGESVSPSDIYSCTAVGEEEVPMDKFVDWAKWHLPLMFGDDFGEIMEELIEENATE